MIVYLIGRWADGAGLVSVATPDPLGFFSGLFCARNPQLFVDSCAGYCILITQRTVEILKLTVCNPQNKAQIPTLSLKRTD